MGRVRPAQYSTFVWPIPGSRRNGEAVKAKPPHPRRHCPLGLGRCVSGLVSLFIPSSSSRSRTSSSRLASSADRWGLDTEQQSPHSCRYGAGPLPARRGLWPVWCVGAAAPRARGAGAAPPSAGHASCDRPRRRAEGLSGELSPLLLMHVL